MEPGTGKRDSDPPNGTPKSLITSSIISSVPATKAVRRRITLQRQPGDASRSSKQTLLNPLLIEQGVTLLLRGLGVDLGNRNFLETPERVARFYQEMFGQREEPNWEVFPDEYYCNMVLLRNHSLWSLCPHHLLPVKLTCSIAYLPTRGKVLGLSKLARVVNFANGRPLLQEEFTHRIAKDLSDLTGGSPTASYVRGRHMCARIRGVRTEGDFATYAVTGKFETDTALQARFFDLLRR